MANPFTRFLARDLDYHSFVTFIGYWDRLEALVVSIYKNEAAGRMQEREYEQVWGWLRENYSRWQIALRPYWTQPRTGGQYSQEDPFAHLLAERSAADFVGDWSTMQSLPAAREALNRFVLDQTSE